MKYFLDCEFIEDGRTIDLISIGLVAEDGRELYYVNQDAPWGRVFDRPWLTQHVVPHLPVARLDESKPWSMANTLFKGFPGTPWASRPIIRDAVTDFMLRGLREDGPLKPELWGYYSSYDFVAFCQLWGPMMTIPSGMPHYINDLTQWARQMGNPRLPRRLAVQEHNALNDASWVRTSYRFLEQYAERMRAMEAGQEVQE